jgi:predicted PurR-regulated permease PerM
MEALNKTNKILFFLLVIFVFLYFGSSFLIPLIFGIFFASLMAPVSNFLERQGVSRMLSSLISTLVVFVVVGGLLYLFINQMRLFIYDIAKIRTEFQSFVDNMQERITALTTLSPEEQRRIFRKRSEQILNSVEIALTGFFANLINVFFRFLIVLVYVFLLLYYRTKISDVIALYTRPDKQAQTRLILGKIGKVVYQYLWGRVQVMILLGLMYFIVFMIFDIPYAVLLTFFGALVTIVPYIGPFISGLLPMIFAAIFLEQTTMIIIFIILIAMIQLFESYVLEPLIIGKEVELNPLIVIIAITIGNMIWGLSGMILFVPIFAMIKIISNHSPGLEPIGFLFGTSKEPVPGKGKTGIN